MFVACFFKELSTRRAKHFVLGKTAGRPTHHTPNESGAVDTLVTATLVTKLVAKKRSPLVPPMAMKLVAPLIVLPNRPAAR